MIVTVTLQLSDYTGEYSAFSQNLLMSILFCAMLRSRGSLRGQWVAIAVLKGLGTAFASIGFCFFAGRGYPYYLYFLGASILFFDIVYVIYTAILTRQDCSRSPGCCSPNCSRAFRECPPMPWNENYLERLPLVANTNRGDDDDGNATALNVFPLLS